MTTTWLGVLELELEPELVLDGSLGVVGVGGAGVATGVEVVTGIEVGTGVEIVTGVEVVVLGVVLEAAADTPQPDVVPHAVPPTQLWHSG